MKNERIIIKCDNDTCKFVKENEENRETLIFHQHTFRDRIFVVRRIKYIKCKPLWVYFTCLIAVDHSEW